MATIFTRRVPTISLYNGARRGQRELARVVGQWRGLLADPPSTGVDYSTSLIKVRVKSVPPYRGT